MRVRLLRQDDIPRLKGIHSKTKSKYPFPDTSEFIPIPVIVDDNDEVVMAVASMPTVELYFFCDPDWETPGMRFEAFRLIHEYVRQQLESLGVVQVHALLPPSIEKSFGKRLMKSFGWRRSFWPLFSRRVKNG